MHTTTQRIGWIISGNQEVASSRLQGFLIHKHLIAEGFESEIIFTEFHKKYNNYSLAFIRLARDVLSSSYNMIFFERPNWMMLKLSLWCRTKGIRTIGIRCDDIPGEYDHFFDATIVPTTALASKLRIKRAYVIEDMIEVPLELYKRHHTERYGPLKVVWVGHGSYQSFISNFIESISKIEGIAGRFEFITISKGSWATYAWSLETVYSHILECDIAIIPMPGSERFQAKSANRLTMFMALGMPVIAAPIPSYKSICNHSANCILASSIDDFRNALIAMEPQGIRKELGENARKYAWQYFSPNTIAAHWLDTIREVISLKQAPVYNSLLDYTCSKILSL